MPPNKDLLVKRIKEITGLTLSEFCDKHLFTNYTAFKYRRKHGCYHPNEVMYMSLVLQESPQVLFGRDFFAMMLDHGPTELKDATVKLMAKVIGNGRGWNSILTKAPGLKSRPSQEKISDAPKKEMSQGSPADSGTLPAGSAVDHGAGAGEEITPRVAALSTPPKRKLDDLFVDVGSARR